MAEPIRMFPSCSFGGRPAVKICGVRTLEDAQVAVEAGATAIGLVLAEGSPRRLSIREALQLRQSLGDSVLCIAVVRNIPRDDPVLSAWEGALQIHGDESEDVLAAAKDAHSSRSIIRAFAYSQTSVTRWLRCPEVDAILLDGDRPGTGGAADWQAIAQARASFTKPFALAGGLTTANVREAIAATKPDGVDASSGVEQSSGVKSQEMIREFCAAALGGAR